MRNLRMRRRAFSLVELLVVIAIIGVLVALLLPAVQAAREAARRAQCANHLKQLGLAAQMQHDAIGHFAAGGWSFAWVGDSDRGSGMEQPGGWIFNTLPYLEQGGLYRRSKGLSGTTKLDAAAAMCGTPIPVLNCPSRRESKPYPAIVGPTLPQSVTPRNAATLTHVALSDYAANGGSVFVDITMGPSHWNYSDPPNYAVADSAAGRAELTAISRLCVGVVGVATMIAVNDITDGTSSTLFCAEKYLSPDYYEVNNNDWGDLGDNETMYLGNTWDIIRFTDRPPYQDRAGFDPRWAFGSSHAGGFNACTCDGAVRMISYAIDKGVFRSLGDCGDGKTVRLEE
jgi:prepilin-type N-terminal cleavage/methylation domain-containing protein